MYMFSSYSFISIIFLLTILQTQCFNKDCLLSRNLRLRLRQTTYLKDAEGELFSTMTPEQLQQYQFVPPEVGNEIYIGTIVSLIPIVWATYEFTSRIIVQRNCLVCSGSGLAYITRKGTNLTRPRKCWSCGGFIPWLGWKMFFFSTFFDPGNGGVLQRPSKDYEETNERIREQRRREKEDETSP